MRINAVRFQNFRTFGNEITEIKLDAAPATLVVGTNGSGKTSSLLESISFGLFGKPFNYKLTKGQLVNSITRKGMLVEIDVDSGGHSYTIRRGIKPNFLEVSQDGMPVPAPSDVREFQEWIEKNVLRMNVQTFRQIVVLGKDTHVPFMRLTAAQRREVVEDVLDIQVFSLMNQVLKERADRLKQELVEAERSVAVAHKELEVATRMTELARVDVDEQIEQKQLARAEFVIKRDRAQKIVEEKEEAARQLSADADRLVDLEKRISEMRRIKDRLEHKRGDVVRRLAHFAEGTCPTCSQSIPATRRTEEEERRRKLDEGMGMLEKELDIVMDELAQVRDVNSRIAEMNRDIVSYSQTARMSQEFIDGVDKEIEHLHAKGSEMRDGVDLESLQTAYDLAGLSRDGLTMDARVMGYAHQMLKDGGVKAAIVREYVPVMNQMINKYLGEMDLFVDFHLDENFNEIIRSRYRDEFTYEMFSAGEKLRIDLAILFAWRAIAKMRTGGTINLLVFDEILDSSLDDQGVDDFLALVNSLTGDQNVFIISHKREQLSDKFASGLRFTKRNNFSKMEVLS